MSIFSHLDKNKFNDILLWLLGCLFASYAVTYVIVISYFDQDYLDLGIIHISQPGLTIFLTIFLGAVVFFIKGVLNKFADITENVVFIFCASLFLLLFIQITSTLYLSSISSFPASLPDPNSSEAETQILKTLEIERRKRHLMGGWTFVAQLVILLGIIQVSIKIGKLISNTKTPNDSQPH